MRRRKTWVSGARARNRGYRCVRATLATESVKFAADGAAMTFNNEWRIARDAQGRVYQERWYLVPEGGQIESTMNWFQIADPNHLTLYNCSTEQRICDLVVYDPTNSLSALSPHKGSSGPLPQDGGNVVWEDRCPRPEIVDATSSFSSGMRQPCGTNLFLSALSGAEDTVAGSTSPVRRVRTRARGGVSPLQAEVPNIVSPDCGSKVAIALHCPPV
jgi:hypothetical protein